jgi:hypothetical protein
MAAYQAAGQFGAPLWKEEKVSGTNDMLSLRRLERPRSVCARRILRTDFGGEDRLPASWALDSLASELVLDFQTHLATWTLYAD